MIRSDPLEAAAREGNPEKRKGNTAFAVLAAAILIGGSLVLATTGHVRAPVLVLGGAALVFLFARDRSLFFGAWIVLSPLVNWFMFANADSNPAHDVSMRELFNFDWLMTGMMFLAALMENTGRVHKTRNDAIYPAVIAFVLVLALNSILKSFYKFNSLAITIHAAVVPLLAYYSSSTLFASKEGRAKLGRILVVLAVELVLIGVIEMMVHRDPLRRLRWPFIFWETYGFVQSILFLMVSYRYTMTGNLQATKKSRVISVILLLFMLLGIFFTLTRNVWLVWLVGCAYYIVRSKRIGRDPIRPLLKGMLLVLVIGIAAVLLLVPDLILKSEIIQSRLQNTDTVDGRVSTYILGIQAFLRNPLMGIGFRNFRDYTKLIEIPYELKGVNPGRSTIHNVYIGLLTEAGAPGLLAYLLVLLAVFRQIDRFLKNGLREGDREAVIWGIASMAILIMLLMSGIAYDPIFDAPYIVLRVIFVIVGACCMQKPAAIRN